MITEDGTLKVTDFGVAKMTVYKARERSPRRLERLDPEAVVTYALQIGRGLAHAHARESSTATSRARTS